MSLSKSIYELTVVAGSVGKVLEGSSKIIQNDVFQWYQNGFVPKTIRDSCDSSKPMYDEMQTISNTIRNKAQASTSINKENPFQSSSQKRNYSTKSYAPGDNVNLPAPTTPKTPIRKPNVRKAFEMSQSEVPSGRLSRIFHYGSLAAELD